MRIAPSTKHMARKHMYRVPKLEVSFLRVVSKRFLYLAPIFQRFTLYSD